MLIIPVPRRPDWQKPPVITLIIMLVCTFVYFVFQSGEEASRIKPYQFYAQSALPDIELPAYLADVQAHNPQQQRPVKISQLKKNLSALAWVVQEMEDDKVFMEKLRTGNVIPSTDPRYTIWSQARQKFESLKAQKTFTERFGFSPAHPTWYTWITHIFMHGSPDHLLGNMVFLFIVGYIVEEALGSRRYLAFYLLAGLGGALMDYLVTPGRSIVGIGASGAVSGVMAMFVVLFGMQKIRFFYWVFIYFNFFRAPALIVLPFWIVKEGLERWLFPSNTNHIAHIGGFLAGGLLAGFFRWRYPKEALPDLEKIPITQAPGQQRKEKGLARVEQHLKALDFDAALNHLAPIAVAHPQDEALLLRYYKLAKRFPTKPHFHRAAALLFNLPVKWESADETVCNAFSEYMREAKPSARFSRSHMSALAQRMARLGRFDDASRLIQALKRRDPTYVTLPDLFFRLGRCQLMKGQEQAANATFQALQTDYPHSEAAALAQAALRSQ